MKERIHWAIAHTIHWAVLYAAFVEQIQGAIYIALFGAWACAVISLALLNQDVIANAAAKPPLERPVMRVLSITQAWVTLLAIVYHGHIITGIAWLFFMIAVGTFRHNVRKTREQQSTAQTNQPEA